MTAQVTYRLAHLSDAPAVAALHVDSWQRHYRGAYSDAFLDGDVAAERLAVWTNRMRQPQAGHFTIVAERGGALVGFVHTVLDADPAWGTLVDNLHVVHGEKRRGIGTRLMGEAATIGTARRPDAGFYLWVLEQNVAAQAFYKAVGGECVERGLVEAPGGVPAYLTGAPTKFRYAWVHPARLTAYAGDEKGNLG